MARKIKCTVVFRNNPHGRFLEVIEGNGVIPNGVMLEITENFIKELPDNPIEMIFKEKPKKFKKRQ